ncbi:hypothetical protein BJ138DRAFT_1106181 [Hygrophoropsis aurantiaca]|uniref:Uncharacterized protein n=1 Tax=Hygrophoropsis aurantiaca TaxID=72124 RepID=A0ACB7ZWG0_9AGAM|nr:hypothetical protein BJ138DRAFT_1106181 [Hygrophoropsis aurantiaca]
MSSLIGFLKAVIPVDAEDGLPLKFGILGAAAIAPPALITPAKSRVDVVVFAVAARDIKRAEGYAKKYGIPKCYGGTTGYQAAQRTALRMDDEDPCSREHALLEKPNGDTAEETRRMFDLAERKGLALLEAFHYRFHPAIQRAKAVLDSGELGAIKSTHASLAFSRGIIGGDNGIRVKYDLDGGAVMDCYPLSCLRYLTSSSPSAVLSATAIRYPKDPRIDTGTTVMPTFPPSTPDSPPIALHAAAPRVHPRWPDITARGSVELFNFVMPVIYHSITVCPEGGAVHTEKAYSFPKESGRKGEDWWSTYRYQLEAFVDKATYSRLISHPRAVSAHHTIHININALHRQPPTAATHRTLARQRRPAEWVYHDTGDKTPQRNTRGKPMGGREGLWDAVERELFGHEMFRKGRERYERTEGYRSLKRKRATWDMDQRDIWIEWRLRRTTRHAQAPAEDSGPLRCAMTPPLASVCAYCPVDKEQGNAETEYFNDDVDDCSANGRGGVIDDHPDREARALSAQHESIALVSAPLALRSRGVSGGRAICNG